MTSRRSFATTHKVPICDYGFGITKPLQIMLGNCQLASRQPTVNGAEMEIYASTKPGHGRSSERAEIRGGVQLNSACLPPVSRPRMQVRAGDVPPMSITEPEFGNWESAVKRKSRSGGVASLDPMGC
jgi:hypothetical protein